MKKGTLLRPHRVASVGEIGLGHEDRVLAGCGVKLQGGRVSSELLTWYLGNLSAFWACWARWDRVMDLELSSRKPRVGLIQGLAESLENSRSMRRTEWGQRDTELIFGGFEIGGIL